MTTQPAPTQPLPGGPGSDVQQVLAGAFGGQPGMPVATAPTPDQLPPPAGLPRGFVMPNYGHPLLGQDPNAPYYEQIGGSQAVKGHSAWLAGMGCGILPSAPADPLADAFKSGMKGAMESPELQAYLEKLREPLKKELLAYKRVTANFLRELADVIEGKAQEAQRQASEFLQLPPQPDFQVPTMDELLANEKGY